MGDKRRRRRRRGYNNGAVVGSRLVVHTEAPGKEDEPTFNDQPPYSLLGCCILFQPPPPEIDHFHIVEDPGGVLQQRCNYIGDDFAAFLGIILIRRLNCINTPAQPRKGGAQHETSR